MGRWLIEDLCNAVEETLEPTDTWWCVAVLCASDVQVYPSQRGDSFSQRPCSLWADRRLENVAWGAVAYW